MKKLILLIGCGILFYQPLSAQIKLQHKEPPKEMENLVFLIGKWQNTSDQWYDAEGTPIKVERSKKLLEKKEKKRYEIAPIMNGLYLEGGVNGDMVRAYFYYHPTEEKYYHLAIDFMGATSLMTGQFKDKTLVFTDILPQKNPKGGTIMWRRKLTKTDTGFFSIYEYSSDEGITWKMRGQQAMDRVN